MNERLEEQIKKVVKDRSSLHEVVDLIEELGREELGVKPDDSSREEFIRTIDLEDEYDEEVKKQGKVFSRTTDWKGRCTVIMLDPFDGDSFFVRKFATPEEALGLVERKTSEEKARIKRMEGDDLSSRGHFIGMEYTAYYPNGKVISRGSVGKH